MNRRRTVAARRRAEGHLERLGIAQLCSGREMGVELVELDQLSLPGSRITRSPSPTVFGPTRWMRRPAGQCEFVGVTDQNVLKILLKVTDKGD